MIEQYTKNTKQSGFLQHLWEIIESNETPPNCPSGNDKYHILRLLQIGQRITFLAFDWEEFVAAVLFHEVDRSQGASSEIDSQSKGWLKRTLLPDHERERLEGEKKQLRRIGLRLYVMEILSQSKFSSDAKARIVNVIVEHPKMYDEPGDSALLTAFRIVDKIDRMRVIGLMTAVQHRSSDPTPLPLYDPEQPFGYDSAEGGGTRTIWADFFRVFEWYWLLASEEARALVPEPDFRARIAFVRQLGKEIADVTGAQNRTEDDLRRALGPFYEKFKPAI